MPTLVAVLARVRRIHFDQLTTGTCCLVRQHLKELRPRRIQNAFRQTRMMNHATRVNIFYRNQTKAVNDLAAKLVREVLAPVSDTSVNLANRFLAVSTLPARCSEHRTGLRTLGLCTHLALDFTKVFLITAVELGCRDGFVCREKGKVLESHVDTNLFIRDWQRFRFRQFTGEARPPLTRGIALDGTSLGNAFQGSVKQNFDLSDFRQRQGRTFEFAPDRGLREGEGVVAIASLESGIAWFFSRFNTPKEGLHCKIKPQCDVLKDLAMHGLQRLSLLLESRDGVDLSVEAQASPIRFIGCFSLFKQVVVQPPGLPQVCFKGGLLRLGWVKSVLESLTHGYVLQRS